ncbi:hypothetical protein JDV02_002617 [Purpureocillium takamizusanense]|uniref:Uncharacterized protein n=1 Tax=Purpureocillium takamizusanense TaxID=2060973 RepID=A0A9Q8QBE6_9HYPO|nr:uncharacterized protein JDV02_002617 [Purpureocillium takamizusanense]UNI16151.1 hypothetical protein JDV02_002617 [Purpureocillium takamizusanense]
MEPPGLADVAIIINDAHQLRNGVVSQPLAVGGLYYARQIMPIDLSDMPAQPQVGKRRSDWASSATGCSTSFDNFDDRTVYSMSTAPPRRGPVGQYQYQQRPDIPVPAYAWPQSWPELDAAAPEPGGDMILMGLPCEFHNFSDCFIEYAFDQVEQWIQHIADDHLGHRFPRESRCWFCDAKFVAATNHRTEKSYVFRERMLHIAEHLEKGVTAASIRPDFPLLDHLWEYRIIDRATFQWAKGQSEPIPMPRDMTFSPPEAAPPRGETYLEERRARHHHKRSTHHKTRGTK